MIPHKSTFKKPLLVTFQCSNKKWIYNHPERPGKSAPPSAGHPLL